jgi:hypothetical protein
VEVCCLAAPGFAAQFETKFSPAQQDAVLAHELAHLAARDPLWVFAGGIVVASNGVVGAASPARFKRIGVCVQTHTWQRNEVPP